MTENRSAYLPLEDIREVIAANLRHCSDKDIAVAAGQYVGLDLGHEFGKRTAVEKTLGFLMLSPAERHAARVEKVTDDVVTVREAYYAELFSRMNGAKHGEQDG